MLWAFFHQTPTKSHRVPLRLEMMPRLEDEIDALRRQLTAESAARFAAEQESAVAEAKLEASFDARAVGTRGIESRVSTQRHGIIDASTRTEGNSIDRRRTLGEAVE